MLFSTQEAEYMKRATPFSTVAMAGHVLIGNAYCTCGTTDCICDPGETAIQRSAIPDRLSVALAGTESANGPDIGASVMLLTLVLLLALRMRF